MSEDRVRQVDDIAHDDKKLEELATQLVRYGLGSKMVRKN